MSRAARTMSRSRTVLHRGGDGRAGRRRGGACRATGHGRRGSAVATRFSFGAGVGTGEGAAARSNPAVGLMTGAASCQGAIRLACAAPQKGQYGTGTK